MLCSRTEKDIAELQRRLAITKKQLLQEQKVCKMFCLLESLLLSVLLLCCRLAFKWRMNAEI